ncbi:MAG: hypothetical protein GFH25_541220n134 [Chloroflexi bacterium AL-N10]|nr:hypothetical protein [Chloroflexi bacterium AL-N1]NOK70142.1 hypothetical protein [Chloroflexi bacterium AL-N10]NOK77846.1 hypothetical protein [Chloroflexi bacterium AL-N5]NOK91834.1 hypothetical protein [Chloroflexi bacterium AL-N15]
MKEAHASGQFDRMSMCCAFICIVKRCKCTIAQEMFAQQACFAGGLAGCGAQHPQNPQVNVSQRIGLRLNRSHPTTAFIILGVFELTPCGLSCQGGPPPRHPRPRHCVLGTRKEAWDVGVMCGVQPRGRVYVVVVGLSCVA